MSLREFIFYKARVLFPLYLQRGHTNLKVCQSLHGALHHAQLTFLAVVNGACFDFPTWNHTGTSSHVLDCLLSRLTFLPLFPAQVLSLFLKIYLFIYLFLAALGVCSCVQAFSSCSEPGLLFVVVCRLLIAVASLVVERGL